MQKIFLETAAFLAGLFILALEILGFRMFAPFFGFSVFVSGTLIGVVLISLAIGYYAGGFLADKHPNPHLVFKIMLLAGIYCTAELLFFRSVLQGLAMVNLIFGTLAAAAILLGAPMILLSMISPFIVKLTAKEGVGLAAGRVSSIATIGSIGGSFLTTFLFIPSLGVTMTLMAFAAVLIVFPALILGARTAKYFVVIALLFTFPLVQVQAAEEGMIFHKESVYNTIRVIDHSAEERFLILNRNDWIQSIYYFDNTTLETRVYYYFNAGPILSKGTDVLILGMGAGTSAAQLLEFFNDVHIDAVEIDPDVVEVSYTHFGIERDNPRLTIYVEDARRFLQTVEKQYDFIEMDMYQGGPFIPFYMVTQEAFQLAHDKLKDTGVVMVNVISPPSVAQPTLLVDHIGYTLSTVFPSVYTADLGGNTLLIATKQPTTKRDIRAALSIDPSERIGGMINNMKFVLDDFAPVTEVSVPLTDDRSPLEQLTFALLNYS
jgi:spermidine synthase